MMMEENDKELKDRLHTFFSMFAELKVHFVKKLFYFKAREISKQFGYQFMSQEQFCKSKRGSQFLELWLSSYFQDNPTVFDYGPTINNIIATTLENGQVEYELTISNGRYLAKPNDPAFPKSFKEWLGKRWKKDSRLTAITVSKRPKVYDPAKYKNFPPPLNQGHSENSTGEGENPILTEALENQANDFPCSEDGIDSLKEHCQQMQVVEFPMVEIGRNSSLEMVPEVEPLPLVTVTETVYHCGEDKAKDSASSTSSLESETKVEAHTTPTTMDEVVLNEDIEADNSIQSPGLKLITSNELPHYAVACSTDMLNHLESINVELLHTAPNQDTIEEGEMEIPEVGAEIPSMKLYNEISDQVQERNEICKKLEDNTSVVVLAQSNEFSPSICPQTVHLSAPVTIPSEADQSTQPQGNEPNAPSTPVVDPCEYTMNKASINLFKSRKMPPPPPPPNISGLEDFVDPAATSYAFERYESSEPLPFPPEPSIYLEDFGNGSEKLPQLNIPRPSPSVICDIAEEVGSEQLPFSPEPSVFCRLEDFQSGSAKRPQPNLPRPSSSVISETAEEVRSEEVLVPPEPSVLWLGTLPGRSANGPQLNLPLPSSSVIGEIAEEVTSEQIPLTPEPSVCWLGDFPSGSAKRRRLSIPRPPPSVIYLETVKSSGISRPNATRRRKTPVQAVEPSRENVSPAPIPDFPRLDGTPNSSTSQGRNVQEVELGTNPLKTLWGGLSQDHCRNILKMVNNYVQTVKKEEAKERERVKAISESGPENYN